jgi:hypothetical protein
MGWEKRKRGGRYYTRSRKIAGRVGREYVGTGPVAEAAAAFDELARREQTVRMRAERERLESGDAAAAELDSIATVLTRAVLVEAGFHQHHRGEWRRRRSGRQAAEAQQERR